MEKFRQWYLRNYNEITWFLIGFLIMGALVDLGQQDYVGALLCLGIAFVNYLFVRNRT